MAASVDPLASIGSRWALQILILLLDRPRRFADLRRELPAISAKLLTTRLRDLADVGIVRRDFLPPPAAAYVYTLASENADLRSALALLGRWRAASPVPEMALAAPAS